MINTIASFLGNSNKSVSNWKKEKRPVIMFLYKYFTKKELSEFIETGRIKALDEYKMAKDSEEFKEFQKFLKYQEYLNKKAQDEL